MQRLVVLLALVASTSAGTAALAGSAHPSATRSTNHFAGPIVAAARPLDRDVETGSSAALREVACVGDPTRRCWVATP